MDLVPQGITVDARSNGRPDCTVNPEIEKEATQFAFVPAGCSGSSCTGVRAIVLSFRASSPPIPHGAELFTCLASVTQASYTIGCEGVQASDDSANPIALGCTPFSGGGGGDSPKVILDAGGTHDDVIVTARLETSRSLAGLQVDIVPEGLQMTANAAGRPSCTVNPAINKDATAFAFQPPDCDPFGGGIPCSAIRAVVLAFDNVDPIPNGAELFRCEATAIAASYTVGCGQVGASDASGNAVLMDCLPYSGTSSNEADKNGDGIVDDFELLDYIDLWSRGGVDDFALLDAIDLWAKR